MAENPHYKELLQLLNQLEVEYLISGRVRSHEVMASHVTRKISTCGYTIHHRILPVSLERSGSLVLPSSIDGITTETFAEKQVVYQIGIAPVRI